MTVSWYLMFCPSKNTTVVEYVMVLFTKRNITFASLMTFSLTCTLCNLKIATLGTNRNYSLFSPWYWVVSLSLFLLVKILLGWKLQMFSSEWNMWCYLYCQYAKRPIVQDRWFMSFHISKKGLTFILNKRPIVD